MYLESRVHWTPIFFAVWTLSGWLACYIIAWTTGHIDPLLPLISMCGAEWPESSVFSLFMNVSAMMSGILCYFRFRQVQYFQTRCSNISVIWKLNVAGLFFGLLSSLGLLIVANFQESKTPWPQVYFAHVSGALITFSGGIVCAAIQAALTHAMHPEVVEMSHFWMRFLVALVGVFFYIAAITTGALAHIERTIPNATEFAAGGFKWDPESDSYSLDLAFAACEWCVGLAFVSYFVTLYPDFKRLKLRHCFDSTHRSLRTDSDLDSSNLISRQSSMRSNRSSNRTSQEYERQF